MRYELDIDAGKLSEAVTAIDLASATGFPDGMVVTPDGKSCVVSFYNPDDAPFGLTQQFSLSHRPIGAILANPRCASKYLSVDLASWISDEASDYHRY